MRLLEKNINSFNQRNQDINENLNELELIDQNEFESWLAVNQLIVNVSPNYEKELLEIETRVKKILIDQQSTNDSITSSTMINPFSPEIIFNSFSEAIHDHFINNDVLLILYHQFEKVVDNCLFDVYKEINQIDVSTLFRTVF
ncbi:DUF1631 family protein [sulfur-oxidizing endosymbiont of Gigantopelta aegis]|uniref:DUF1631 family protein n=1 Tax=sulfur-oxidizing endosymbiont of Gigantopelta aegis TaxID=2794934 RepID=UPI0018DD13FF|nr:DUF1631 family protein [sulfur-oxidizing endosymbiont of Gigantopelta aegis]